MTQIPWKKSTQTISQKSRGPTRINIINTQTPANQSRTEEQIKTKTGTQPSSTNSTHTRWASSLLSMQSSTADGSTIKTSNISPSGIQVSEWMETTEPPSEPTVQWDASSGVHLKLSQKHDQANRISEEKWSNNMLQELCCL